MRPSPTASDSTPSSRPGRGWVLATSILGSSLAYLNGSSLNVALPAIQTQLDASTRELQWILNSYALFLAALILVGGAAGDRFGQKRTFLAGVALFTASSVACGLAPGTAELIAARAFQGLGGALAVPTSLAIITRCFEGAERGRAIGTWAGFAALTSALGPLLGGWLVDVFSWREVFYVTVPVGLAAIVLATAKMPDLPGEEGAGLDVWGALWATAGLGAVTYGLIEASELGFRHPAIVGSFVGGAAALGLFLNVERRTRSPMMPLGLFRSRTFSGANLLTLFLYFALGGALFFLPFNLIQVQGYSATAAGAAFLPFTLVMASLSRWAGGLIGRFGARAPLVAGSLVTAVAFVLFAVPGVGGSYWSTFLAPMVILGLGMALSIAPLTTAVMSAVEDRRAGAASGINNAVSRLAWMLAVAVLGVAALAIFRADLDRRMAALDLPAEVVEAMAVERDKLAGAEVPASVGAADRRRLELALDEAFVRSFRAVVLVAAALALASAGVAATSIRPEELRSGGAPATGQRRDGLQST